MTSTYKYALSTLFILGCASDPAIQEETVSPEAVKSDNQNTAMANANLEWSYAGSNGPAAWGDIRPEYLNCKTGNSQSPINLKWSKAIKKSPVSLSYKKSNVQVENTGYTYRLRFTPTSSMNYKGENYLLEKMEIRTPTEHALSGNNLPMEMQFYHKSSNGLKTAMLSLIVIEGKKSDWFDTIWNASASLEPGKSSKTFETNPAILLPPAKTHYHYTGSLTHPPCSEGVDWFIYNTPLQLSRGQIMAFRSKFSKNNRKVQPLNGRKVTNH